MIKRILFILVVLLTATVAYGQTFDADGGWQQSPCMGGAKGFFYTEKFNNHWWFCTPEGNHFYVIALSNFKVPGANASTIWASNVLAKYGGSLQTAAKDTQSKFIDHYGFNTVGELSNAMYYPWSSTLCTGCKIVPGFSSINISVYATVNLNNRAQRPVKNYILGLDDYFVAYRGAGCTDVFDPQYQQFANNSWGSPGNAPIVKNVHSVGITVDDTDFMCGMGASSSFDTFPPGHSKAEWAFLTLQTSDVETFNPGKGGVSYQNTPELFTDDIVHSKALSPNPPTSLASCWSRADTTKPPCSLLDMLFAEYKGDINALNAAWHSTYTGWTTSGSTITNFLCGMGTGSLLVFNCSLPVTAGWISPLSVGVFEGTQMVAGDCAWFEGINHCAQLSHAKPPYNCAPAGSCEGVLSGDAASPIASGVQPWLSDNPCGATGANPSAPHAAFAAIVNWHGPGLYTPSRQTSEGCAAGQGDSIIAPLSPPAGATGYDVYMSCKLFDSTTPAFGCSGSNTAQAAPVLQASNIALGTAFTVPSTGLTSGAALPTPSSFIDYGTGNVTLTFSTAPAANVPITINAIAGGWMWGTGLSDEDGRHAWLLGGSNPYCMIAYAGGGDGTPGYGCRPGNAGGNPTTFVSATIGQDLENWLLQGGARYFGVNSAALKAANPNILYFGPNVLGDWRTPAHANLLQAGSLYIDVFFTSDYPPQESDASVRLAFLDANIGDKPVAHEEFLQAAGDSAESICSSCTKDIAGYGTQAARGQGWITIQKNCLADPHCLMVDWWSSADFNGAAEVNNWGLTTPNDNDYNGIEPSSTALSCIVFPTLPCGNEPQPAGTVPGVRPFGDAITGVIAGNKLWYQAANTNVPAAPSNVTAIPQ